MATQTANLGLKKPEGSDYVQVSDFNGNSDLLDAIIGKLGELRTEEKSSLVAAINEAMISGGLDSPYVDSATGHWFTWDNTHLKFTDTGVVAAGGRWYTGTAITGTSSTPTSFDTGITLAQPGDLYLHTVTSYVYLCVTAGNRSTAKWTYLCSIKGNTGEQGLRGLTGAVFTPSVNATTGIISWTNDGGLTNPPSVNIKGQKGDTGSGLNIKGIYASLAALQEAVPSPLPGDMYNIGESAPYRVYMYDANLGWTDIGQIQGPTGPAGKSAYVAAVEAGYTGNEDTFNAQMSAVATHVSDTNNPHGVTKAQVGLGNVDNVRQYSAANPPPYPVKSFNGRDGNVAPQAGDYTKGMVGLGNVDNTSDVDKPVSTAQQEALNGKQAKITASGLLKGNGAGGVSAAVKGTDYAGPSVGVSVTLRASGWNANAKTQTVSVAGVTATANGSLRIAQSATDEQFAAWGKAQPRVTAQADGSITVKLAGTVPTMDIPVEVLIV